MVDGAPLPTERSGGADWSSLPVPIDDIERIEYVAGPKTAQYGPYAASGVINIITRRVSPELWDKEKSTASVSGGTQGYGRMSVSVNEQKGKDSYSAWFTYRDSNGFGHPTDPNGNKMVGERNGDKNDGCLGGFSLNHVIDKGRTIRLDTSIYQSTYEDVLTNTSNNHFDTDHRTIITRLLYKDEPSDDKSFEFSIIHQDKRYDFSSAPFGPLRTEVDEKFGNFQIQARHRRTDKKGRTLTFGANYEELTGSGVEYETKAKEDDFSIFGLVDIPVSERNTLLVGLNHYSSSVTGGDFTYNLSMLHKLSPGEVIRTGVGSGIRAPVMTPIHYHTLTLNIPVAPFTVDLIRGNENLDNEQYKQIDLGYERRWRKSSFKADLYWMKSDDRIRVRDEDPTANTQLRFYNEDDALVVKGGTLSYEKQITKKFKGYFAYRYTDSDWENQFQGKYAPKHLFQANMTYKPNYHWSLNMLARSLSDYESSVVNDGGASEINGYTTADLAIFSNTVVL